LKTILSAQKLNIVIERLSHQLLEKYPSFENTAIIGIQPRGVALSNRIYTFLKESLGIKNISYGQLDITFYRDDFNNTNELRVPSDTNIAFDLEGKNVILIDDVLYTGRTIRSAMDALIDFGRPAQVELMVLINRKLTRQLPIEANYVGLSIDSIVSQKVKVCWKEVDKKDEVILIDNI
jgi:pyrimidine operon attenuation protein / uracil phosphoribosyltransferase